MTNERDNANDKVQQNESDTMPDMNLELERSDKADDDVPEITSLKQARSVIESLLFATTEPLSIARLERLTGLTRRTIRGLTMQLEMEYYRNSGGLQIIEVAGGYQMATRPECHPWLARLNISRAHNKDNLSVAALETLAIIAYKQPVTRLEVDAIRGVDSSGMIRKLVDFKLVKPSGRTDPPQRAYLYSTTKEFLRMFGLKNIKDLPSLPKLRELMGLKTLDEE